MIIERREQVQEETQEQDVVRSWGSVLIKPIARCTSKVMSANAATACGLIFGTLAVIGSNRSQEVADCIQKIVGDKLEVTEERLKPWWRRAFIAGLFFDWLDGAIAKVTNTASAFGKWADATADRWFDLSHWGFRFADAKNAQERRLAEENIFQDSEPALYAAIADKHGIKFPKTAWGSRLLRAIPLAAAVCFPEASYLSSRIIKSQAETTAEARLDIINKSGNGLAIAEAAKHKQIHADLVAIGRLAPNTLAGGMFRVALMVGHYAILKHSEAWPDVSVHDRLSGLANRFLKN